MSFEKLRQQLDRCSGQILPSKHLAELNPKSGYYQHLENTAIDDSDPLLLQVAADIASIPELKSYEDALLQSAFDARSVNLLDIARWTLAQARLRPAREVVERLQEFVSKNCVPMSEIIALWGLNPIAAIKLANDVSLVPVDHLIPSDPKDQLTGVRQNLRAQISTFPQPRIGAALKRDFVHGDILHQDKVIKTWVKSSEKMREIAHLYWRVRI
jgi:hypothetical protein